MDFFGLAKDQKKAKKERAHIVFIDESGLLMAPLLRRTWGHRGQTPQFFQEGGARQKVSVAGALRFSPHRRRFGLDYQTLENDYYNNVEMVSFLEILLNRIPGQIIVVWDGGSMHKGDPIRDLLRRYSHRLSLEKLPPYAPMLNPVEQVWQWLKYGHLCNYAAHGAHELNRKIIARLNVITKNQKKTSLVLDCFGFTRLLKPCIIYLKRYKHPNPHSFKLEISKNDSGVTSFGGLALLRKALKETGLINHMQEIFI